MIYKFKSRATGDLIMLGPLGDQMLRLLGREPSQRGIIEPQDMLAAMALLQAAIAQDDAVRAQAPADEDGEEGPGRRDPVALRQRLWPMLEMLRRAQQAGEPVVWGV